MENTITGGDAFTQLFDKNINCGDAIDPTIDVIIKGGSALIASNNSKWLRERREYRKLKRMYRNNNVNIGSFNDDIELFSYDLVPTEPPLKRSYLRRLAKKIIRKNYT